MTNAWLRSVTSSKNFFIRPWIIFSITASGLPLSRACSVRIAFSRSIRPWSRSASESDAGAVAATCMAICLPMPLSLPFSATSTPIFPSPSATALCT